MELPSWLMNATGAGAFANNPANGFKATLGDAMQGIGHSMMEHYRHGQGTQAPQGANPLLGLLGGQINPMGILGGALGLGGAGGSPAPLAGSPSAQPQVPAPVSFDPKQAAATAAGANLSPLPKMSMAEVLQHFR
jgi:hypothetical protein